jgi:UDP-N-acetylmuramate--alanine ligase
MENVRRAYFIGIGGIGMSALARYFHEKGVAVSGYDRTPSDLTDRMQMAGMDIHFEENLDIIPRDADLVVYTPAIPSKHRELQFYRDHNFKVRKRSEVLQEITEGKFTIAIAGSHGKTTVTAMIAHVLKSTGYDCTAFIGGIALNYDSNFISGDNDTIVVEADEFDRSFLRLSPNIAVVTAVDTDHLDIYGSLEEIEKSFAQFCRQVKPGGYVLVKEGSRVAEGLTGVYTATYSLQSATANCYARNIRATASASRFDWCSPDETFVDLELNYPGQHNIENAVAAIRVARWLGAAEEALRTALRTFKGLKRRFEFIIKRDDLVFIDDYAHHPREITALITAVRGMYPDRRITAVFQPHLYTRTRDLAREFAASLSLADEVLLLDIYPARELPLEGVSSRLILDMTTVGEKELLSKSSLLDRLAMSPPDVLLTIGAGDIDRLVKPIRVLLETSK